jgi:glutamate decarboxylase
VEREIVAWFHRLIFGRSDKFYQRNIQNPRISLGNVTSDGTIANLTALMVAREKAFPPNGDFHGVRVDGVDRALKYYGHSRGVVIVSTRGHYSIKKAANMLGIGEGNVLSIPVDDFNRIDLKRLKKKIMTVISEGGKIIALVGIAGTTETGNVDNLQAMSEIVKENDAHFHVDACWGGSALLVDEYLPMFHGIKEADSVSIDAHKLLYCPMTMGLILFRHEKDLHHLKQNANYIIRRNSVDTGRFTIEGSRPFACLKPWASLKIIGREGYGLLFRGARKNTDTLQALLESCGNFEVLNFPELFIVNYRFIPAVVKRRLKEWDALKRTDADRSTVKREEGRMKKVNHIINALNIKLHKALRRDDTTFVSRTTLESTRYRPTNIVVLRAVLINPLTNRPILQEIVDTQNRLGLEIWPEFVSAYRRISKDT